MYRGEEFLTLPEERPTYVNEEVWERLLNVPRSLGSRILHEMEKDIADRNAGGVRFQILQDLKDGLSFSGIVRVYNGAEELEKLIGPRALKYFQGWEEAGDLEVIFPDELH